MTVVWNYPTRILFGENSADDTAQELRRLGGTRALIVSDPGVVAAGLAARLQKILGEGQVESEVFGKVAGNPTDADALAATAAYREARADCVVALGGGSAVDIGKIVRLLATHPEPLAQYD